MQYLVIIRPRFGAEMRDPLALTAAGKQYWQELLDRGIIECAYQFVNQPGSAAIVNAASESELRRIILNSPGYPYGDTEVFPLTDAMAAFDAMLAQLQQPSPA